MKTIRVRLTFIEEILGTASGNPAIHTEYIASKAPDAETMEQEIEAIGTNRMVEKSMTIFSRNADGDEILWPYQIRGFFKSAQKAINKLAKDKKSTKYMPTYKSIIDTMIFVKAVQDEWEGKTTGIVIHYPEGVEESYDCERPLRAETAQGPRIALAHSETCPEGSWIEMDIRTLDDGLMRHIPDMLNYGIYNGIGQWRSSGRGRFLWEEIDESGKVIGGNKG